MLLASSEKQKLSNCGISHVLFLPSFLSPACSAFVIHFCLLLSSHMFSLSLFHASCLSRYITAFVTYSFYPVHFHILSCMLSTFLTIPVSCLPNTLSFYHYLTYSPFPVLFCFSILLLSYTLYTLPFSCYVIPSLNYMLSLCFDVPLPHFVSYLTFFFSLVFYLQVNCWVLILE